MFKSAVTLFQVFVLFIGLSTNVFAAQPRGEYIQPDNLYPKVKMVTNFGDLIIELDRVKAPITVDNFLSYVDAKRYDNTLFHRLEQGFVLQGGGFSVEMESVKEFDEIVNESGNGVKNNFGTIAMARQNSPHTATSQFFFNLADNDSLNPGRKWGYAVFGSIIEGDSLFEKLQDIQTDYSPDTGWRSFPNEKIIIIRVEILAES